MDKKYLIIVCGFEGIAEIVGLFEKEVAIERMKELRSKPHNEWTNSEQYCIGTVDETGWECCCSELGFGLEEPWLM